MSAAAAPCRWGDDEPNAMISTGCPAASLPATRGSDPTILAVPFDGRQGTRLKISVADFATSFTVSIALLAMLRCAGAAAPDESTAATLPAPVVGDAGGLVASVLALSESVACWAACARSGATHGGVSSATPAVATAASHVVRRKGW